MERFVPYHQDMTDPATSFSHQLDLLGFHVLHCEARPMKYTFGNANRLAAALRAVNPFLGRLSGPAEQSEYTRDLMKELAEMETPGMDRGRAEAR